MIINIKDRQSRIMLVKVEKPIELWFGNSTNIKDLELEMQLTPHAIFVYLRQKKGE
jgi:hypothetical protein